MPRPWRRRAPDACQTPGVHSVLVAVVGPTASGKSDLGLALAEALDGEVVNADAMQLYRGMDIGTAKLPAAERRGVPHHLLDVLDVTDEASVAAYQRSARAAVEEISARGARADPGRRVRAVRARGARPTGVPAPPTPACGRALEAELADVGPAALHRRLADRDPAAAAAILPSNGRRIVRALEVVELTGQPFTATLPTGEYRRPAVQIGSRRATARAATPGSTPGSTRCGRTGWSRR